MWILYGVSTAWFLSVLTLKLYNFMDTSPNKQLDMHKDRLDNDDEYILLCYCVTYEDGEYTVLGETTAEEIEELNEINKIDYIIIKYMFNGKLMKYVTRTMDIEFPIYNFNVEPTKYPYYPDIIFINNVDVTNYIRPYLGPLCNFYSDRPEPITLKDAMIDHPKADEFNYEEGTFQIISNMTPLNGRKSFVKELPCEVLNWKRHAAVDPRDESSLET